MGGLRFLLGNGGHYVLARCLSVINLNFAKNWGEEQERMMDESFQQYLMARKWRVLGNGITGGSFLFGIMMAFGCWGLFDSE